MSLELSLLPDPLTICRLPAATALPAWVSVGGLTSVTWTSEETSIVCLATVVPPDVPSDAGWRAFRVAGPLDFNLTGVLLAIAQPLADAGVSIFAVSTYDTDYVLVKEAALPAAVAALTGCGHRVV